MAGNHPDEAQLVRRCLAGEAPAWRELYDAHARSITAYFLRSGFDHARASDLTQEVFLRVMKSLRTFDAAKGTPRTWISAIARNIARRQWRGGQDRMDLDPELAEEVLAIDDNPSLTAQAQEEFQAVGDCVGKLPDELAAIVRLRYVQGLTTRGVSQAAQMPEATVRLRLAEALDLLEKCLKSKGLAGP